MGINILNANLYQQTTRMALIDGLTGLYNKQVFNEFLSKDREFSERSSIPFFLALFDIDDFKKINDTYGHLVGDDILKKLGAIFLRSARKSDIIARFGGEEFAWIIHNCNAEECFNGLERVRNEICTVAFPKGISVSVSIGLTQYFPNNNDSLNNLINRADSAMYQAKAAGKNRTIMNREIDFLQFQSGSPNLAN
jgi:diguanylate cyclase (GGDEF)-like protein